MKTVTHFAAFVSCGVGRPTRRLRPDGKPAVMEEVDGFLGEDDVPEGMALSAKLVKKEGTRVIIGEGEQALQTMKCLCVYSDGPLALAPEWTS